MGGYTGQPGNTGAVGPVGPRGTTGVTGNYVQHCVAYFRLSGYIVYRQLLEV